MVILGKYSINGVFRGNRLSDLCDLAEVYSFVCLVLLQED